MGNPLNGIPLRLGPLEAAGFSVRRSGLRWLCDDGHLCRPGEAVAYCNVGLTSLSGLRQQDMPFAQEGQDLQAVLAPRVGGRIRRAETSSRGGFLDRLDHFQLWNRDYVLGHLEPVQGGEALAGEPDELELFMVAGRRYAEMAEGLQGLLTGWHDRSRAWRVGATAPGAVLSLGTCELAGVMRGDSSTFLELFEAIRGPGHAIHMEQEPLVPCARVLVEQLGRTPAQFEAISADLIGWLAKASPAALPSEWVFAGGLLNALKSSPLTDGYDLFGRAGLHRGGPADAVVLSANAETRVLGIHRQLGYAVAIHSFRLHRAGPNLQAWFRQSFEGVVPSLDDIARDYRELVETLARSPERTPRHILVLNTMSSAGDDDLQTYAGFDAPLGDTLATVHGKDVNLLLHDLARDKGVAIVDADAITAEIGAQRNLPDGTHGSGAFHTAVRQEVLHILRERGVPGFEPALAQVTSKSTAIA